MRGCGVDNYRLLMFIVLKFYRGFDHAEQLAAGMSPDFVSTSINMLLFGNLIITLFKEGIMSQHRTDLYSTWRTVASIW